MTIKEIMKNSQPMLAREYLVEHIHGSLVDRKRRQKLLQNTPHKVFQNLAIIPELEMEDGSVVMTYQLCAKLGMTQECVMSCVRANTEAQDYICQPIKKKIKDILLEKGTSPELVDVKMDEYDIPRCYILSNEKHKNGATVILSLGMLMIAWKMIEEDYYIFPISRHEVLAMGKSIAANVGKPEDIMLAINATHPNTSEILTDTVYYFDGEKISSVK